MNVLGIDIGGTHLRIGVMTDGNQVQDVTTIATRRFQDAMAVVAAIGQAADEKIKCHDVRGVGLAIPGILEEGMDGTVLASNCRFLTEMNFRAAIEERLELPTVVETDANAAALAEYRLGAGRGSDRLVVATIGTGVGVGVVLGSKLVKHTRGTAGSLGHLVIDAEGPTCGCGGKGCLEALASGRALLTALGIEPDDVDDETWAPIIERLTEGDRRVRRAVESIGLHLGVGVSNWLALFQPDRVVLRGGVCSLGSHWLNAVKAGMLETGSPYHIESVSIRLGELSDEAGILGAGLAYADKFAGA